jgi:acyl carrier protein
MLNNATVFEFLKNAVLELKDIEPEDIELDTSLEALALDSLDYVDVQVNIRKTYKVEILPELFTSGRIKTIGELAAHIVSEADQVEAAAEAAAVS